MTGTVPTDRDAGRWTQVKALFYEALERDPATRATFLQEACGNDTALREAVEGLLRAHVSAEGFLDNVSDIDLGLTAPQSEEDAARAALPSRVGPYRVLRELGRGGMGTVYLAEREEGGFRKEVAIKVVRSGMDSRFVRRRFETERQILAGLEHPGIARLYDGGTTEGGLPYFVMEHVDGQNLLDYCDGRRLPVPQRLRLFRRVCEAVQYAHQALVVHRDLKPSNVLVTAAGDPKLLDFGIAKLLTPPVAGEADEATLTMVQVLTPDYASPEHVRGEPVTTASDVYSLGVILYEVLSGHRPYRLATRRAEEIQRALVEQDPAAPSTVVGRAEALLAREEGERVAITPETVCAQRETVPSKLRRLLSGDLDNIVLKALQKDPARRYATPAELSDDIGRFLDGRPVLARPDTWSYRAAKFVRRHRMGLAAGAVAVISLLTGLGVALWQARVARAERTVAQRRFDEARRLIQTVIFDIQPKLGAVPGTTPMRKALIESTLQYLEALANDAGDNPALLRELAGSYVQLARVQGDASTSNVGDPRAARQTLAAAEKLTERLLAVDPRGPESLRQAIAVSRQLSRQSLHAGEAPQSQAHARRAVELGERLVSVQPGDFQARADLADAVFTLASSVETAEAYERSRQMYESLLLEKPDDPRLLRGVALVHKYMATIHYNKGEHRHGIDAMTKARQIDEKLLAAHPEDPTAQMDVAIDLSQLSTGHRNLGDLPLAISTMQQSVVMRERILAQNPGDARAQDRLAYALSALADYRGQAGDAVTAFRDYERARNLYSELRGRGYAHTQVTSQLARTELALGSLQEQRQRHAEACGHYRQSVALYDEMASRGILRAEQQPHAEKARRHAAACP